VPEVREGGEDRVGCRLPEAAEAADADDLAERLDPLERGGVAAARDDALEERMKFVRPGAAREAFAARFVHAELHEVAGDLGHADLFVHDDQPTGAHDRTEREEGVVIHRGV
jgi:hypothetical protein